MRIDFGASIYSLDGRSENKVQQLILEAQSKVILYLVIGKSKDGRLLMLPPNLVERSQNSTVFVRLSKEQVSELPEFVEWRWVNMVTTLPSPTKPDEGGAKLPSEWLLTKEGFPYAPGTMPHTAEPKEAEHLEELPQATVSLRKYTRIQCLDSSLGILKGVALDDYQNRVSTIIVRKGVLFPREKEIPADWITAVSADAINVGADSKQVMDLIGPPSGSYLSSFDQP